MTLSSATRLVSYTGNGVTTEFALAVRVDYETDLKVALQDATTLVLGDPISSGLYSVTGIGEDTGVTVTYPLSGDPLSSAYKIVIYREVPYTQELGLTNQGRLYLETVETQIDRITMQTQQLAEQLSRAYVFDPGQEIVDFVALAADVSVDAAAAAASALAADGSADDAAAAAAGAAAAATAAVDATLAGYVATASGHASDANDSAIAAAASAASVVTQTTDYDTTNGRILTVGAFGLGSAAPDALSAASALDNIAITSLYAVATANVAAVNGPSGATDGVVSTVFYNSTNAVQTFAQVADGRTWRRSKSAGTWGAWSDPDLKISQIVRTQVTTPGTYLAGWTKPAGLLYLEVEIVGGGGGGGGADGDATNQVAGLGGGGGGYSFKRYAAADLSATENYVVGYAGTGGSGANPGNSGTLGGPSAFKAMSAAGGQAGTGRGGAANVFLAGIAGGEAGGGDIDRNGGWSGPVKVTAGIISAPSTGGSSFFAPQQGGTDLGEAGKPNVGFGGGGAGAFQAATSSANLAGGNGGGGVVIFTEYLTI